MKSIRPSALLGLVFAFVGCAVPQKPGNGKLMRMVEPTTQTEWWLYLPEGYPKDDTGGSTGKRWPVVATFHGLNPYDAANPQARSWQQEADRYGYIVVAPKLRTCNPLMQYPVREVHKNVVKDEEAFLLILDEVFRRTDGDPNKVLSTSWSAGGYFAHYIVNRHPERFSCLSVYQSNFSESILDPRTAVLYRDMPIGIFLTENDFNESTKGSKAAMEWYRKHRFSNVRFGVFKGLGHERTPEMPALVFAKSCGAVAKTPPPLSRLALIEDRKIVPRKPPEAPKRSVGPVASKGQPRRVAPPLDRNALFLKPVGGSRLSGPVATSVNPVRNKSTASSTRQTSSRAGKTQVTTIKPSRHTRNAKKLGVAKRGRPPGRGPVTIAAVPRSKHALRSVPVTPKSTRTPRRRPVPIPTDKTKASSSRAYVRLSTSIGISPLLVSFTAELQDELKKGADFLWTDNGIPICNEINGQKILMEPGRHRLEVLIITKDNRELRASSDVTVFERLTKKSTDKNG